MPLDDVVEVSNYVGALEHGLMRIKAGFPLSNRLIREMHGILLAGGRGADKRPGEFRRSQNWIGGTRPGNAVFVPPPPESVDECMGKLELYLHDQPRRTPPLLKAALSHVQFETIHPFLDGNGRVGRILITLLLCVEGVLRDPLLYLSLYLKQNRIRYYALLDDVRRNGAWEEWLDFFATGVVESATGAVTAVQRLVAMADHDFKLRNAQRFLSKGSHVEITVRFRGPELRRPDLGHELLDTVQEDLSEVSKVETRSRHLEGRQLTMMLSPAAA